MENNQTSEQSVLVVEDNPTNLELLLQQLKMLGYIVDSATDGIEALEKMACREYRCILTDINMPLMDGYQLTQKIREMEQHTGRHHIIIAITAKALMGDKEKCIEYGMDDYLAKPIDIFDLKSVLEKYED